MHSAEGRHDDLHSGRRDRAMRPISIREASQMMKMPEQFVRVSIYAGKIPGAYYLEGKNGKRGKYFITDTQVENMMKGVRE